MLKENPWANPWLRGLIVLLVVIAAFWIVSQVWALTILFGDILLLFFLAWLLAFVLGPPAKHLHKWGVPRIWAVSSVYGGLGILIVIAVLLLTPTIAQQLSSLADNLLPYSKRLQELFLELQATLVRLGLKQVDLTSVSTSLVGQLQSVTGLLLQNTITIVTGAATLILNTFIVLILSFYIMLDGERLSRGFVEILPPRYRRQAELFNASVEQKFGGFIRGQLFLGFIYGLATGLAMWPAGLEFKLIVGIVAGAAMMIPFVGTVLAVIPPLAIAVFQNPGSAWWLLIVLLVMQQVTLNVIAPRVMSGAVGIHPLLVFLALLVGAKVAGVWGALFGIPMAGVLEVMIRHLYQAFILPSRLYQEGDAREEDGGAEALKDQETPPPSADYWPSQG